MRQVAKDILEVMAPLVEQGKVRVLETSRGVSIEINDSILFSPGQALLQPALGKAMQSVAEVLVAGGFPDYHRGHTDNIPIRTLSFPRTGSFPRCARRPCCACSPTPGVAAERLTAIGYADTRPVEPNVLADGRARNRRVTILIDSDIPEKGTELDLQGPGAEPRQGAVQTEMRPLIPTR
jgi:chemotaxis protein MotB